MVCQILITKEDTWFVATDFRTGIASQGHSIDESLANLREALELYFENNPDDISSEPTLITTLEVHI